jgi:hypothetical protein
MAGAQEHGAGNADGFKHPANLSDRCGGAVRTPGINVEQSVGGLAAKANADESLRILPALPEDTRPHRVVVGVPSDFGLGLRIICLDGLPRMAAKDLSELLSQGILGSCSGGWEVEFGHAEYLIAGLSGGNRSVLGSPNFHASRVGVKAKSLKGLLLSPWDLPSAAAR